MAQIVIGGTKVQVDVADTPETRRRGLAGQHPSRGMLFVFDQPGHHPFHMYGMLVPLDFVWVSADQQVVDVTQSVLPDRPGFITSKHPVQYVIELPAGFTAAHGISVGDDVTL